MATLQIEFNCLCLFAADEANQVMHVLMPATNGHEHHGMPKHLVRLIPGKDAAAPQIPIEGWIVELGPETGEAALDVEVPAPPPATPGGPSENGSSDRVKIVDLEKLTRDETHPSGRKIRRELVEGLHPSVATRFTLRSGRVIDADADAVWKFGEEEVRMAHRVVWEMKDVDWTPPAGMQVPKAEVWPDGDALYYFRVFHTVPTDLPPRKTPETLPEDVALHFGIFYDLLEPAGARADDVQPVFVGFGGGKASQGVQCGSSTGKVT